MLAQRERLLDAEPTTPEHHDHRAQPPSVRVHRLRGASRRRSPRLSVDRLGRAFPCWGERAQRESRGASPVSGAAGLSRGSMRRSWVLLPFARRIVRAALPGRRSPRKRGACLALAKQSSTERRARRSRIVPCNSAGPTSSHARLAVESSEHSSELAGTLPLSTNRGQKNNSARSSQRETPGRVNYRLSLRALSLFGPLGCRAATATRHPPQPQLGF